VSGKWTNLSSRSLPLAHFSTSGITETSDCVARCETLYYSWCQSVRQSVSQSVSLSVCLSQSVLPQSSSSLETQFILCNHTSKWSGDVLFEAWPGHQLYWLILISVPQGNWQDCTVYQMRPRTLPFISLPIYHLPIILLVVDKILICSY
jgi:hypothetical protein